MSGLPIALKQAIADFARDAGDVKESAAALSDAYRSGSGSAHVSDARAVAAYLVTRMPATYAAVSAAMKAAAERAPDFAPRSLIDAGAGPGTAAWAAVECWPSLERVTMLDSNPHFLEAAHSLAASSGHEALKHADFVLRDIARFESAARCDLVVASYAFAEWDAGRALALAAKLWAACDGLLLVIEPGTPAGFRRIRAVRESLIAAGAKIGAPCVGEYDCPLAGDDWCHFAVRLPRSRAHIRAKNAELPFEDEKFSYVVAFRETIALAPVSARILARPHRTKPALRLKLCTPKGLEDRIVPARDRPAFKAAVKKDWGDAL